MFTARYGLDLYIQFGLIFPMFHTLLHLHVALTIRTNESRLGTFQEATLVQKSGNSGWTSISLFSSLQGESRLLQPFQWTAHSSSVHTLT